MTGPATPAVPAFDHLASAATTPAFGAITPNMTDDMHDGTVAQGDS